MSKSVLRSKTRFVLTCCVIAFGCSSPAARRTSAALEVAEDLKDGDTAAVARAFYFPEGYPGVNANVDRPLVKEMLDEIVAEYGTPSLGGNTISDTEPVTSVTLESATPAFWSQYPQSHVVSLEGHTSRHPRFQLDVTFRDIKGQSQLSKIAFGVPEGPEARAAYTAAYGRLMQVLARHGRAPN
jgi:hypothetical protein